MSRKKKENVLRFSFKYGLKNNFLFLFWKTRKKETKNFAFFLKDKKIKNLKYCLEKKIFLG